LISESSLAEQQALRAELITAKVKAGRLEQAGRILGGVSYCNCPQCGSDVSSRLDSSESCRLCGTPSSTINARQGNDAEALRRELNDRIDQIADSIERKQHALQQSKRELQVQENIKIQLDQQLQDELRRYDSAFVESIRMIDREIAMLEERIRSLEQLQEMPRAISELEEQAGASQGIIDRLRSSIEEERSRLMAGDAKIRAVADKFKQILVNVGFPGISDQDEVLLDPRNWKPTIVHFNQEWGFWDTGSGGKKTVFNVCYALAVHEVARDRGMPVPNLLIIDSPTKNISDDENPDLVRSLYREIYRIASDGGAEAIQFVLIDSDLVEPEHELMGFSQKRMAGEDGAPRLISYYVGP
jgi:DNA repair exonuclease SbcCD ATPase subunit